MEHQSTRRLRKQRQIPCRTSRNPPSTSTERQTPVDVGNNNIYLYRAVWLVLVDIDASKVDRDHAHYKYRAGVSPAPALDDICKQHSLKRFGHRSRLHKFTGRTLYDAVRNMWERLRTNDHAKFRSLWLQGSDGCKPEVVREMKAAYDALAQAEYASASDQVVESAVATGDDGSPRSSSPNKTAIPVASSAGPIHTPHPEVPSARRETIKRGRKRKRSQSYTSTPSNLSRILIKDSPISSRPSRASEEETPVKDAKDHLDENANDQTDPMSISPNRLTGKQVAEELNGIFFDLQDQLVPSMIRHLRLEKCSAPVTPEPNHLLTTLYKRCWGNDWRHRADKLLVSTARNVTDDTSALVSAFLLENVLICPRPRQVNHDELSSTITAMHKGNKALYTSLISELSASRTENLTSQLFDTLRPHFFGLARLSRLMYALPFEGDPDPLSYEPFRSALSQMLLKASTLRQRLDTSKLEYDFFWPAHGESYNPARMQVEYQLEDDVDYSVAFTKFPGVTLTHSSKSLERTNVAYKAYVVLQAEVGR